MKKILVLTALAALAFGCSRTEEANNAAPADAPAANAPANTTSNTMPVPEENYTSGANPRSDLISATQKLQKLQFWSARITSETMPEANAEMQYLAPDRYRIKKTDGEVIVIGKDSYTNEGGKWEKMEDDVGEYIREQTRTGIEEGVRNLQNVEVVGKDKINGKDATVYAHTLGEVKSKIWIGTESGLQLRNEVEANFGGTVQKQTTVYDYDTPVKIEAPKIEQ
jgi:hypothetical protein